MIKTVRVDIWVSDKRISQSAISFLHNNVFEIDGVYRKLNTDFLIGKKYYIKKYRRVEFYNELDELVGDFTYYSKNKMKRLGFLEDEKGKMID